MITAVVIAVMTIFFNDGTAGSVTREYSSVAACEQAGADIKAAAVRNPAIRVVRFQCIVQENGNAS